MKLVFTTLLTFFAVFSSAQIAFMENRGQVIDSKGNLRPDVLFTADGGSVKWFLMEDRLAVVCTKHEQLNGPFEEKTQNEYEIKETLSSNYRFDIKFSDCNASPTIITENPTADYLNFYLPQCPEGLTHVRKYERVTYQNIYHNIDFVIYAHPQGVKYNFIVHPGGDPGKIFLEYDGVESLTLNDSKTAVTARTPLGTLTDKEFVVVQGEVKVPAEIKMKGDKVQFDVRGFNRALPLIIDPVMVWETLYGGDGGDGIHELIEFDGRIVGAGTSTSTELPLLVGEIETWMNLSNVYLTLFSMEGIPEWSAVFGGSGSDQPYGLEVNEEHTEIVLTGATGSEDFVTLEGCSFDTPWETPTSDQGYFVKFNSEGTLLLSQVLGGDNETYFYELSRDSDGNYWIAGETDEVDFPISENAFQNELLGAKDGILLKVSPCGEILYSTFLGDVGIEDLSRIIVVDDCLFTVGKVSDNVYFSEDEHAEWSDILACKFDLNGQLIWARIFGSYGLDWARAGIAVDLQGNLVIGGRAEWGFPTTADPFNVENLDSNKFLTKIDKEDGSILHSILIGQPDDGYTSISNGEMSVALNGNIWWVGSVQGGDFIADPETGFDSGSSADMVIIVFDSELNVLSKIRRGSIDSDHFESIETLSNGQMALGGWTWAEDLVENGTFSNNLVGLVDAYLSIWEPQPIYSTVPEPVCIGGDGEIEFITTITFDSGNVFQVELSTPEDAFSSNWVIGELESTVGGILPITMPPDIETGTYWFRVTSTSPESETYDVGTIEVIDMVEPQFQSNFPYCDETLQVSFNSNPGIYEEKYYYSDDLEQLGPSSFDISGVEPGFYTIAMVVVHQCGTDTAFNEIEIIPTPQMDIGDIPDYLCDWDTLNLNDYASPLGGFWMLDDEYVAEPIIFGPNEYLGEISITYCPGIPQCFFCDYDSIEILDSPEVEDVDFEITMCSISGNASVTSIPYEEEYWTGEFATVGDNQLLWNTIESGVGTFQLYYFQDFICSSFSDSATLHVVAPLQIELFAPDSICSNSGLVPIEIIPDTATYWVNGAEGAGVVIDGQYYIDTDVIGPGVGDIFPFASVTNVCSTVMASQVVLYFPHPNAPIISQEGDYLVGDYTSSNLAFVQWFLNGEPIFGADGESILITESGLYTLEVCVNGCCTTSETFIVGIEESDLSNDLLIYPNPSDGQFTISCQSCIGKQYMVTDILGKVVAKGRISSSPQKLNLDIAVGIYDLTIGEDDLRILITKNKD